MEPFVRDVRSNHPRATAQAPGKVLRLGDVPWDDIVDLHGKTEDAGFCRRLADSDRLDDASCALVAGVYRLDPGVVHPLHVHPSVAEFYLVLHGSGAFTVGDEEFVAEPGTAMYIPAGMPHAARGLDEPVQFFYTFPTGDLASLGTTFI